MLSSFFRFASRRPVLEADFEGDIVQAATSGLWEVIG